MANQIIKAGKSNRFEWFNRNPVASHINYNSGAIAPHVDTERASYTVSTGKSALVHGISLWSKITTAATTPGRRYISVNITNGVEQYTVNQAIFSSNQNTAGTEAYNDMGFSYTLLQGEKISLSTADTSTGGTMSFYGALIITEFDSE